MVRLLLGCGFAFVLCLTACGESTRSDNDSNEGDNGGSSGGGGTGGSTAGKGGGGAGGTSGGGVPIEQLPSRFAEVACGILYGCCTAADRADDAFAGMTEEECRTNYAALFTLIVPPLSSSVSGDRVRYDAEVWGACFDLIEAAGCSPIEDAASCEGALVPLVSEGGACSQNYECIGTTCLGESGSAGVTDGTCGAPLPIGAYCEDDDDCADGYCVDTCTPKLPNGEYCVFDEECQSDHCDQATYVCVPPSTDACN